MYLKEYQAWTPSTARYPAQTAHIYLGIGVQGEVGEFIGCVAKIFRGDKDFEAMKEKLVSESGDILWFCSQIGNLHFFQIADTFGINRQNNPFSEILAEMDVLEQLTTITILMSQIGGKLQEAMVLKYDDSIKELTRHLLYIVELVSVIVQEPIESLARKNKEKLTERVNTGTIKGSGETIAERI